MQTPIYHKQHVFRCETIIESLHAPPGAWTRSLRLVLFGAIETTAIWVINGYMYIYINAYCTYNKGGLDGSSTQTYLKTHFDELMSMIFGRIEMRKCCMLYDL